MKIKMGPVQSTFQGKVTLLDIEPPESEAPASYKMRVNGRGPAGNVDGAGNVRLEPNGDKTIMYYEGDANVSGRIASVGQRVMDTSARAIVKQSLDSLASQIQARLEPPATPTEAAPEEPTLAQQPAQPVPPIPEQPTPQAEQVPGPTQAEFAFGIAKELFYEFVPEEKRTVVLAGTSLFLIYIFFNWWTNLIARRVARQLKK